MGLILPQVIKTKWNSKHVKYYKSKGYKYTKIGDEFEVNVLDLPTTSQIAVNVTCDYCEKELKVYYSRAHSNIKVSCQKCVNKRIFEECGRSSNWQLPQTKESIKKTFIKNYGVDHNFKSPEIQEKRKKTFIKNYGVDNPLKSEIIKSKSRKTNLERRGVEYSLSDPKIREQIKQTNIERYGIDNPRKNKEIARNIRVEANKTLYKNGTGPCSQQQRYLHNLLGGELNYPVSSCSLDIGFPNEMIYIEYNGGGHDLNLKMNQISIEDFNTKEIYREQYLKSLGWKLIRIICKSDLLLEDEIIFKLINECREYLNTNHSWIEINFDTKIIKCSTYEKEFLK